MTQNKQILKYLKQGNTLTPKGAIQMFKCFRLSARIWDIRHQGERIDNIGKKFAKYKWMRPQTKVSDLEMIEVMETSDSPGEACERLGISKQSFWERLKRLYIKKELKGNIISGWYQKRGVKQSDGLLSKWDEER